MQPASRVSYEDMLTLWEKKSKGLSDAMANMLETKSYIEVMVCTIYSHDVSQSTGIEHEFLYTKTLKHSP